MKNRFLMLSMMILFLSIPFSYNMYGEINTTFIIVTENFPPFNYEKDGKLTGISVEIVKKIFKRLGFPKKAINIEMLPWDIAYKIALKLDNVIIFSIIKTPDREDKFKWVGPIATVYWNIYSLSEVEGKPVDYIIRTLDDAKLYSIGTQYKSAIAKFLEEKGFNHINYSDTVAEVLDKLLNYQTQLIAVEEFALYAVLRNKNLPYRTIRSVFNIKTSHLYIGFNKAIPDEIVEQFQKELDKLKKSGEYSKIVDKYYDLFIK